MGRVETPPSRAVRPAAQAARRRAALWAGALAYLAGVAAVVLWPAPVDRPAAGSLARMFSWLHRHGVPGWFGYGQFEWLANVAFFVPFGVFAVLLGFRAWAAVLGGFAASCAAEAAQFLFLAERTASFADIAANTIGALLGTLATVAVVRRRPTAPRPAGRSDSTPARP